MIQKYLITDPSYLSHDKKIFEEKLTQAFNKHQPDFALYRDKAYEAYEELAKIFVKVCHHYGVKAMLHNHAKLAASIKAYGVHYSSDKLCSIGHHDKTLYTVLSTHEIAQIVAATELGIDAVTFSPIFSTPNKGKPVGVVKLKEVVNASRLPIIALGGIIEEDQINEVEKAGAFAFASIRYFCD